jgi:hypothetical protein
MSSGRHSGRYFANEEKYKQFKRDSAQNIPSDWDVYITHTLTLECRGCGATKPSTVNVLPGVTLVAVHPYTCADCNPKNRKGKAPKRFHGSLRNGYHTVEIDDRQLGEFLSTLGLAAPARVTPSDELLASSLMTPVYQ